jgi:hypothetical protein
LKIFVRVRAPIKETQKQFTEESKYMSLKPESSDKTTFSSTNGGNDNIEMNAIDGLSLTNGDKHQSSDKRQESQSNLKSVTYYGKDFVSINGFENDVNPKEKKNKGLLYTITMCYIIISRFFSVNLSYLLYFYIF